MKLKHMLMICGVAMGLCFSASVLMAQENNGGGQARGGRGNFDPAQFQQRVMDNIKERLAFTNDTEWMAVQPLVQKVIDGRRETLGGLSSFFGRRSGRGGENTTTNSDQGSRRSGFFGQSSPEADVLQKAIESNAPTAQIKAALDKYRTARKEKEAKLVEAQEDLRKVLTVRQEAQAALMGLVN